MVLPTGDSLHGERLEAGDEVREGRLQDLVTQSQLTVAGQTKAVDLSRTVCEREREREAGCER